MAGAVRAGSHGLRACSSWAQNIHRGTAVVTKQGAGPNREALALYREILRTCRGFYWNDSDGSAWCGACHVCALRQALHSALYRLRGEKLAASARKEFEQARYEAVRAAAPLCRCAGRCPAHSPFRARFRTLSLSPACWWWGGKP